MPDKRFRTIPLCQWPVLFSWHSFMIKYLLKAYYIPGTVWGRAGRPDNQEQGEE